MIAKAEDGTLVKHFNPIEKYALKWLAVQYDGSTYKGHEHDEGDVTPDKVTQCEYT